MLLVLLDVTTRLAREHLPIATAGMHQFVVRPLFDDLAAFHHNDPVRYARQGKPVTDDDRRFALNHLAKYFQGFMLCIRIEGGGRFVRDDELCR